VFVIGVSGVLADKTGSAREKYNQASQAAKAIVDIWRADTGKTDDTLFEAVTQSPAAADRIRKLLGQSQGLAFPVQLLLGRFEQFLEESTRLIPSAVDALCRNDLDEFGTLVDQSQAAAERGLGNQIPETIELARSARELGAVAASAFGAGFGGSVWAMVTAKDAEKFLQDWRERYRQQFPSRNKDSDFFICQTGPHALRIQ
jgi:galactokinase